MAMLFIYLERIMLCSQKVPENVFLTSEKKCNIY